MLNCDSYIAMLEKNEYTKKIPGSNKNAIYKMC